jgi:hypothetical protein
MMRTDAENPVIHDVCPVLGVKARARRVRL